MRKRSRSKRPYKKPKTMPARWKQVGLFEPRKSELKRMDVGVSSFLITETATILPLNIIRQGTADYQRIGNDITMKSLLFTGQVYESGTRVNTFEYIRYLIVYDRQTNGILPSIQTILELKDLAGGGATTAMSPKNHDFNERYLILLDKRFGNPSDTSGIAGANLQIQNGPWPSTFHHYIPLKGLNTKYLADGTTISAIGAGAIYLVALGLHNSSAANYSMSFASRLMYDDI